MVVFQSATITIRNLDANLDSTKNRVSIPAIGSIIEIKDENFRKTLTLYTEAGTVIVDLKEPTLANHNHTLSTRVRGQINICNLKCLETDIAEYIICDISFNISKANSTIEEELMVHGSLSINNLDLKVGQAFTNLLFRQCKERRRNLLKMLHENPPTIDPLSEKLGRMDYTVFPVQLL